MKKLITVSLIAMMSLFCYGKTENRALQFKESGKVESGSIPSLEGKKSYSIQFLMKPYQWKKDAVILSYGKDFKVILGKPGEVIFKSGKTKLKADSETLKPEAWSQLTLLCDNGQASVLLDGKEIKKGTLAPIPTKGSLTIGEGYEGEIDEVRLWDANLDDRMKMFDYFVNNTVNKWSPMWENLAVYYKMDQPNADFIVNYKELIQEFDNTTNLHPEAYQHNGRMSGDVRRVTADNPGLPYLINAAYTNNDRFYDCLIPRDQYLLHNELIILGSDAFAEDGRIEVKTPNHHVIEMSDTRHIPEFAGRLGVMGFEGTAKSRLEIPANTFSLNKPFMFATWLYPDDNTTESILLRKESESGEKGLSVSLKGEDGKQAVKIRANGSTFTGKPLELPADQWTHIAVVPGNVFQVYINGELQDTIDVPVYEEFSADDGTNALPVYIGENFNGKLDDFVVWNRIFTANEIKNQMAEIPLPSLQKHVNKQDMFFTGAFYRFDDPANPGHSSHSQDEWLNIMKGAYTGAAGIKYYISVQGTYRVRDKFGDWREILPDASKRARFASDLARISGPYDGVELDLEWLETAEEWENFGILAKEIKETLPEDKVFRVSLHNNYTAFPADKMQYVDGFTFQQYGPNPKNFSYENFLENVKKFEGQYERPKIMTSYATTTSRGVNGTPPSGVKWGMLVDYELSDADVDTFTNDKDTWSFTGPMQVYKRAAYTRDENLDGIFYWDMGNDYWLGTPESPIMPEFNLAKYSSYGLNANNEPEL